MKKIKKSKRNYYEAIARFSHHDRRTSDAGHSDYFSFNAYTDTRTPLRRPACHLVHAVPKIIGIHASVFRTRVSFERLLIFSISLIGDHNYCIMRAHIIRRVTRVTRIGGKTAAQAASRRTKILKMRVACRLRIVRAEIRARKYQNTIIYECKTTLRTYCTVNTKDGSEKQI